MKKLFVLTIAALVFATSCKKVEDDPVPGTSPYKTMTTYMVDNGMDLPDVLNGWIVSAPPLADVQTFINDYFIIDIRSANDYATGHIEGAVNSTLADILTTAAGATKPILIVCYTGQTAGHAVVALRLSGYSDAKVLKFGMSGWRTDLAGPWQNNTGDVAIGHTNWVTTATEPVTTFSDPDISGSGDAATMLATRVQTMLNNGLKGVTNTDVLDNPSNYFINNYWAQADVDQYGHIAGAYRISPLSLTVGEISNLDPSKTVVTYCWTGQTSSMITAYLNVIGFDAVSLKFGANGMIFSDLQSHQFTPPAEDLPVVQ
jgi:rhodanese-related sulfurtransferase